MVRNSASRPVGSLRVAFPGRVPASGYDPARIHWDWQYVFLENIFSPLVEIDGNGQIRSGIAERFDWDGTRARLKLRSDLRTVDGHPITARDAALSLKRLMILRGNTHGNLTSLLCPESPPRTLAEECPGISVNGNTLILQPVGDGAGNENRFLLQMLAEIDFAVIPSRSIDPKTLSITDYRNTSGPYYVSEDSVEGGIVLNANPSHYHYSRSMPQRIDLIPVVSTGTPSESLKRFREGEVDFLVTVDKTPADETISFAAKHTDSNLHATMPLRTYIATVTQNGRRRLSPEKRLALGKALKLIFGTFFAKRRGFERVDQFYVGGLDDDQALRLKKRFDSTAAAVSAKGITIRLVNNMQEKAQMRTQIERMLPGIRVEEGTAVRYDSKLKLANQPDIEILTTDTGDVENLGFLSYSISADRFGLGKAGGQEWLSDYFSTQQKADRIKKLRALHYDSLAEPVLIPLVSCPYVALARKPWKIHLSQFYGNNQFWMVQWRH